MHCLQCHQDYPLNCTHFCGSTSGTLIECSKCNPLNIKPMMGWICGKCGASYSPFQNYCTICHDLALQRISSVSASTK